MKPVAIVHDKALASPIRGWRQWLAGDAVIRFGPYAFQPALGLTLLTLLLFLLLLALGFWQLSRAEAKAQLIQRIDVNSNQPELELNRVVATAHSLEYRWASAEGEYRDTPLILLNNRVHQGRIGFHQLRLFRLAGSDSYLLINQGWVPATTEGGPMLSATSSHAGTGRVSGLLVPVPHVGLRLGEPHYRSGAPLMELPYLDLAWLENTLQVTLQPVVLLQHPQLIDRYRLQRKDAWLNPERHRGYALQWFSLALALLVIYLVANLKRSASGRWVKR